MVRRGAQAPVGIALCAVVLFCVSCGPSRTLQAKPAGTWRSMASGASAQTSFELFATGGTAKGSCVALHLDPPPDASFNAEVANPYMGKDALCFLSPGAAAVGRYAKLIGNRSGTGEAYGYALGVRGANTTAITAVATDGPIWKPRLSLRLSSDRVGQDPSCCSRRRTGC
jgi:hypothetical protein